MQRAYSLGLAYAAKGDAPHLAEQIAALKKVKARRRRRSAEAELEGHRLLAQGDVGPAFDQFAKATSMRTEATARAHLAARNYGFAESVAKKAVDRNPDQVPPMAAYVEILQAAGKEKEAREAYARLVPMARFADRDVPVFRRLDAIVADWKAEGPGTPPRRRPRRPPAAPTRRRSTGST